MIRAHSDLIAQANQETPRIRAARPDRSRALQEADANAVCREFHFVFSD